MCFTSRRRPLADLVANARMTPALNHCRTPEQGRLVAHLLLIDDDSVLIPEQVRQAFPATKHRVEVAGNGAEGLRLAAAKPPGVVLLDFRMHATTSIAVSP